MLRAGFSRRGVKLTNLESGHLIVLESQFWDNGAT
jgi:hypothetical protein